MKLEIEKVSIEFDSEIKAVSSQAQLEELRVKYLGKSGKITAIMPMMKTVPNEQKREIGMLINELKGKIETAVASMQEEFKQRAILEEINNAERIDITLPVETGVGSLHPRTIVQKEIEDVFVSMGFVVEEGYEIETEYNNFDAVNVPANHPARDMQDTFWLNNGQVLKTHTSAAQNRILKKYKNNMPIRAIFPGRCFRNEELDAGHENTFFQLEGIIVDENVSVANLIYFMKEMLSRIFKKEVDVRLRPGFFPFTEPSFEVDFMSSDIGRLSNKWIEIMGCGMVDPNVLKNVGLNPEEWSGYAFGLGVERVAMLVHSIDDIRHFYANDVRFLNQFSNR